MLECNKSDTSAKLIVTLTEKQTISEPNYLFVFKHVLTKEIVTKIFLSTDDESLFRQRYNSFEINPSVLFGDNQTGEWHYMIYEQESDTNAEPALSGELLEEGKFMLLNESFEYEQYNGATAFKSYGG